MSSAKPVLFFHLFSFIAETFITKTMQVADDPSEYQITYLGI
ncbi:hypothetical protein J699_00208 [Acinetobacter sp. 1000160]|nr:hypothetical protein J522_2144 [Acinetobacter baumannii 146457]EYT23776.1 hypothetical protein J699_00208 [Acinetobacter sp. 1000160]